MTTSPILTHPDFNHSFFIQTDACDVGIGAVLCQRIDGKEQVVQYLSRTLQQGEKKWSVREKEALAIVWACEQLRPFVIGSPFTVESDHESLKWLMEAQSPARLVRWALRLTEFDFKIIHRSGRNNGSADGLSRLPQDSHEEDNLEPYLLIAPVDSSKILELDLAEEQKKDKQLLPVINCLKSGDATNLYDDYQLTNNILYSKPNNRHNQCRYVVPFHLREQIIRAHHDCILAAHVNRDKTYHAVSNRYYWPGMYASIERWTNACLKCTKFKRLPPKQHGFLQPIQAHFPFQTIAIDIIGPFRRTKRNHKYVLVMIDLFTSWVEAAPLANIEAQEVCNAIFNSIIVRHGCPTQILSDQGTQFTADLFKAFCIKLGVKALRTTAWHPQTNGKCERFNRFLKNAIATLIDEGQTNWDQMLEPCLFAHRTTVNMKLQETPFYLLYGREVILPNDLVFSESLKKNSRDILSDDRLEYKVELARRLRFAYEKLFTNKEILAAKTKGYYDKSHRKVIFKPDDLVMIYWPTPKKGLSKKFLSTWRGPYSVVSKLGEVTYRVKLAHETMPVHVQRLRKYIPYKPVS